VAAPRQVFAATKPPDIAPAQIDTPSGPVFHPIDVVDHFAGQFEALWTDLAGREDTVLQAMKELREIAMASLLPPLEPDALIAAAQRMKANTGKGGDSVSPEDLLRLPFTAWLHLAQVFNLFEALGTWAWQLLFVIEALLPKKAGGMRGVGLVAVLARLWAAAREPFVFEWATATCPAWDAAVRGNSSLAESYERALCDEVCRILGIPTGTALLDIHKYFDSMSIPDLIREAMKLNFPPTVLLLELQLCLAPPVFQAERRLQSGGQAEAEHYRRAPLGVPFCSLPHLCEDAPHPAV